MDVFSFQNLLHGLILPLGRLVLFVSLGLMLANLIESLNWTRAVSRLAAPLVKLANLSSYSGASFSMAFFSGVAGNTMLSEAYEGGRITRRELILANLFNSLPTYFLHLPTLFFITFPLIKSAAFVYVGLTLMSAVLRSSTVILLGRFLLDGEEDTPCLSCRLDEEQGVSFREAIRRAVQRFRKRFFHIVIYTVPIYTVFYLLGRYGFFDWIERFIAQRVTLLSWLPPESLSIVVFHIAAEFTAGLAAAGALLDAGGLATREVVLALLVGNILSSPVRGVRHQFPFYAGIFSPRLAMELILWNQMFRALSLVAVTVAYAFLSS